MSAPDSPRPSPHGSPEPVTPAPATRDTCSRDREADSLPALLADLAARGITIRVEAGKVLIRGVKLLSEPERDRLRAERVALVALLLPANGGQVETTPEPVTSDKVTSEPPAPPETERDRLRRSVERSGPYWLTELGARRYYNVVLRDSRKPSDELSDREVQICRRHIARLGSLRGPY